MNRQNKLDSESDLSFLGKKRNNEKESKKKNENGVNIKNIENNYESISNVYKNIFSFDWTDSLFKEGQKILENITPDAVIFLYNILYFKQDLFYLNLVNKSFNSELVMPFLLLVCWTIRQLLLSISGI